MYGHPMVHGPRLDSRNTRDRRSSWMRSVSREAVQRLHDIEAACQRIIRNTEGQSRDCKPILLA